MCFAITAKDWTAPMHRVAIACNRTFWWNMIQEKLVRVLLHMMKANIKHHFYKCIGANDSTILTVVNCKAEVWLAYTIGCITGPTWINLSWFWKKIGSNKWSVWDFGITKYRPMYCATSAPLIFFFFPINNTVGFITTMNLHLFDGCCCRCCHTNPSTRELWFNELNP